MPAKLDIEKLTVREVKLVQEMTGKKFGAVIKDFQLGEFDGDTLHALALIWLRRDNPQATVDDALDVEILPMLNDPEDEPTEGPEEGQGKDQSPPKAELAVARG